MCSTKTRFLDFDRIRLKGEDAHTVVKLMMACNDMSLANHSLTQWKSGSYKELSDRRTGAGMYFVRIQLAHLHEGLKVIHDISQNQNLLNVLDGCDEQTKTSFNHLLKFAHKGERRDEFEQLVGRLRHNLTFHYDESGKCIERAIGERASEPSTRNTSMTRGSHGYLWHFKLADDLVDSIVTRQIWGIDSGKSLQEESDKVADLVHNIFTSFMDFSGEFVWKYCA